MTVPDAATKRLIAKILAGHHDAELDSINEAIIKRTQEVDGPDVHWKVTLEDLAITEDDLTLDECVRWEKESGFNWRFLRPTNSAQIVTTLLTILYQTRKELSEDDAVAKVGAMKAAQVEAAISSVVVERLPLDI